MLPIAGQTARPNGLKFYGDTQGCLRLKKNSKFLFSNFFFLKFFFLIFFSTGNAGHFSLLCIFFLTTYLYFPV